MRGRIWAVALVIAVVASGCIQVRMESVVERSPAVVDDGAVALGRVFVEVSPAAHAAIKEANRGWTVLTGPGPGILPGNVVEQVRSHEDAVDPSLDGTASMQWSVWATPECVVEVRENANDSPWSRQCGSSIDPPLCEAVLDHPHTPATDAVQAAKQAWADVAQDTQAPQDWLLVSWYTWDTASLLGDCDDLHWQWRIYAVPGVGDDASYSLAVVDDASGQVVYAAGEVQASPWQWLQPFALQQWEATDGLGVPERQERRAMDLQPVQIGRLKIQLEGPESTVLIDPAGTSYTVAEIDAVGGALPAVPGAWTVTWDEPVWPLNEQVAFWATLYGQ